MLKQRVILMVSLIAMFSVGVARADIAATSYVDAGVNAANTAASNAQKSADDAGTAASNAQTSANNAQAAAENAQKSADDAAASAKTANDTVATKQDKSTEAYQMGNASGGWTAMTTAQKNALNSGITSTMVATYDAYATNKEAVANKLTSTATTTISDTNKDTLYPTVGKVQAMVNALDVTDTAVSGQYVSAVSETDGKISVARASLPTVGNATLTIQRNGTTVDTFTANATSNKTINITVPTGTLASKDAVGSAEITDGAVALADLAANSVNSAKIVDASVAKEDLVSAVQISLGLADTAVQPSAISDMQTKSNRLTTADTTSITDANKDTLYPTVGRTTQMINELSTNVTTNIDSLNTALTTLSNNTTTALAGKQATLTSDNVTSTGNGNVVTAVTAANGVVTVTKATTLGSLATKSTVTSADITDGTIATADIADGAVTVAKTTGLYGVIPSGSQGNTAATAFIWVE